VQTSVTKAEVTVCYLAHGLFSMNKHIGLYTNTNLMLCKQMVDR